MMDQDVTAQPPAMAGLRTIAPVILLVVAMTLPLRAIALQNTDVAWLLTTAEWVLDGRRMSVDFTESNPPGGVLLYLPAALLGRWSRLGSDLTSEVLVACVAAIAAWDGASRLCRLSHGGYGPLLTSCGLAATLLILPAYAFGEREHLGLLLLFPWLTRVAASEPPSSVGARLISGLGIGLAGVAKPHLLALPLIVQLMECGRTRSPRVFFRLENYAAASVLAVYAAAVFYTFPEYLDQVFPLAVELYMPMRLSGIELLVLPGFLLWAVIAIAAVVLRTPGGGLSHAGDVFLAASLGGVILYLLQGKGWPYQIYPAVAPALAALTLAGVDSLALGVDARRRTMLLGILATIGLGFGYIWFDQHDTRDTRAIAAVIRQLDVAPRIAMLSSDISVGFPLTRMVGGVWVQRQPHLWVANGAQYLARAEPVGSPRLQQLAAYEALERGNFIADMRKGQPSVVLAQTGRRTNWLAWARADPELAALLSPFREAAVIDDVTILQRTPR